MSDTDIHIVPAAGPPPVPVEQLWVKGLQETQSQMRAESPVRAVKTHMHSMLQSQVFQYSAAVVLVFVISFILLVVIRPSFTYTQPDDKHETGKFSVSKTALFALSATGLGVIATIIIHVMQDRQV